MSEREEFRELITANLETLFGNYRSTLVGRAFDVIDLGSRAEAIEHYANLFETAIFDPSNLEKR